MQNGIYIGTSFETAEAIGQTILKILEARADQKTIRQALAVFGASVKPPSYTTVSNNVISEATPAPDWAVTTPAQESAPEDAFPSEVPSPYPWFSHPLATGGPPVIDEDDQEEDDDA